MRLQRGEGPTSPAGIHPSIQCTGHLHSTCVPLRMHLRWYRMQLSRAPTKPSPKLSVVRTGSDGRGIAVGKGSRYSQLLLLCDAGGGVELAAHPEAR